MFTGSWKFRAHVVLCVYIEHIVGSLAYEIFQLSMQFLLARIWFISKYTKLQTCCFINITLD